MVSKIFNWFSKKLLWKLSKPISKFLFITHNIAYKDPFGDKPLINKIEGYESNFASSVSLEEHVITKNSIFLDNPPDIDFIKDAAFYLQNVIKKTRNSYLHGFVLYSYLSHYLKVYSKEFSVNKKVNILDIGTARGFSAICLAKALKDFSQQGNIFTFDIIPNRVPFYWNSATDIIHGPLSRMVLLNKWQELVNDYILFFSTATFNSLRVVDIPKIHFAFVDGSHFFNDVLNEINYIVKRLNNKAIIVFDDYDKELFPGVVKACNYLSSLKLHSSIELIEIQNNRKLAIFKFGL